MAHGLYGTTYIKDPHSFERAILEKVLSAWTKLKKKCALNLDVQASSQNLWC